MTPVPPIPSLDAQREAFARRRVLAMPLAGTIAWSVVGVCGWLLPLHQAVLALYVATGAIFYLGVLPGQLLSVAAKSAAAIF